MIATDLLRDFRANPNLNDNRQFRAPTSRPYHSVTNGGVARELPFASALLIRQFIAQ